MTDSQLLIRARMLRENGRYLCKQSFLMRKNYMNHEETGMLKKGTQRATPPPNPMMDPSMMTEMLKGNLTSMVPMVVVGGWINWHFSGFVTTKVWVVCWERRSLIHCAGSLPTDSAVQGNASKRHRASIFGRLLGVVGLLVLPQCLWTQVKDQFANLKIKPFPFL